LAQRGSLVDAVLTRQPRSVRQFTPRPFCQPRSFFFLPFPLLFFLVHGIENVSASINRRTTEFIGQQGKKRGPSAICQEFAGMCAGISEKLITAFYCFKAEKRERKVIR